MTSNDDEESLLRATLESTTDGILVTDDQGNVKVFNGKFLSLWQIDEAEARGNTHTRLLDKVSHRLHQPEVFRARVESIYRESLTETHDMLEFLDGRVFERISTIQESGGRRVGRVFCFRDVSIKRQQDEALRISEEFNRTIIESSRDILQILSLQGHLVWMSESGLQVFGWSGVSHLLGRIWIDLWKETDRPLIRQALSAAVQGNEGHFTASFVVKGQDRWMDVVISPIMDQLRKPEKLLVVTRDVTERRLAEDELRRSENRFRQLADSMPQIVWTARPDGLIDYYNQQWNDYTGVSNERGTSPEDWANVTHPDDLQRCVERWMEATRTGVAFQQEYRLKNTAGQYRWLLARARPIRNERGEIIRWYGSSTDIHDQKMLEEALREETRVLELLNRIGSALTSTLDLQNLTQIITDIGTELSGAQFGAFFQVRRNTSAFSLELQTVSGIPREPMQTWSSSFSTLLMGLIFQVDDTVRRGLLKAPFQLNEQLSMQSYLVVALRSRAGDVMGGLLFGHPQREAFSEKAERAIRSVAVQASIAMDNARLYDDVKKAAAERERLLEAERASRTAAERMNLMKDEFLATLSHELRTPMNAIQGWSEILHTENPPASDLKVGLESIWRNARAQTQLIEDLLDMSRIISGKVRLEVQQVELEPIIDAAFDSVQFAAEAKGVKLTRIIETMNATVAGDGNRLQQVIWNLLSNSLKFTPRGGTIELRLSLKEGFLQVVVRDSGIGIKPEFLPHVFERFRQADSSLTRRYGGLGLGLAIVKQLVEIHGGSVRVESPGEGQGATFTVSVPQSLVSGRERVGGAKALSLVPSPVDLSGVKVLVIDDERDALELIARVLQQYKADVRIAASAAEGRALLLEEKPDVIVSDISMPGTDGYQFMQDIRLLSPSHGGHTPAIALTAFARSEDRLRAMTAGYQEHITKPVEVHKLAATIGNLARSKLS